jgi:hypothetical protein
MNSILGLPAHALLVHAAVVLVPLAVLAFAALCWKKDWRQHYLLPVTLLTVVAGGFAFLAQQSGGPLRRSIRDAARAAGGPDSLGQHPGQGNTAFLMAFLFMLAVVAYWAAIRWGAKWSLPAWTPRAGYFVVLVPAALALVTMLVAGHSGAVLVWRDVGTFKIAG